MEIKFKKDVNFEEGIEVKKWIIKRKKENINLIIKISELLLQYNTIQNYIFIINKL